MIDKARELLANEAEAMLNGHHGLIGDKRETVKRIIEYLRQPEGEKFILPCDVHLPPVTYIKAGCKLSTLIYAIKMRATWPEEGRKFNIPAISMKMQRALKIVQSAIKDEECAAWIIDLASMKSLGDIVDEALKEVD